VVVSIQSFEQMRIERTKFYPLRSPDSLAK